MDSQENDSASSENDSVIEVFYEPNPSHAFHQVFIVEDNEWVPGEHGEDMTDPLNVEPREDNSDDIISVHSEVNIKVEEMDPDFSSPVSGMSGSSIKKAENHMQASSEETSPLLCPKFEEIKIEADVEHPSQLSRSLDMRDASDAATSTMCLFCQCLFPLTTQLSQPLQTGSVVVWWELQLDPLISWQQPHRSHLPGLPDGSIIGCLRRQDSCSQACPPSVHSLYVMLKKPEHTKKSYLEKKLELFVLFKL